MEELKFSYEKEALQYLSDVTGSRVKIAAVVPSIDELKYLLLKIDKIIQFYAETDTELGREFTKILNEKRKLGDRLIDALTKAKNNS